MDKILKIGIVGLGQRGSNILSDVLLKFKDIQITALCDFYQDRTDTCANVVAKKYAAPFATTDYKQLLDKAKVDAVYIATSWDTHIPIAIDFLEAGIPVALEVGGAKSTDEMWELVDAYERTKTPFMFMENCCYNNNELLATAMARAGLFGEIVHCSGAYGHDLREEVSQGKKLRHYRLNHYLNENCENYPTHELGPIAKVLDINRGNRMVSLVSMASKAAGLKAYIEKNKAEADKDLIGKDFKQGDIVNTLIRCENGETIQLKLDTTLPRSYDREFTLRGTKGLYSQSLNYVFFDGMKEDFSTIDHHLAEINNAKKYEEQYMPSMWKNITDEDKEVGHGGMDGFLFRAFIDALNLNQEMPIDVYDAAAWMSISCLSARSIAGGSMPVEIPDFTRGKYKTRPRKDVIKFD